MAFSVNTNAGALVALQSLNSTNRLLDTTQARISTGLKVASAKDNAAIFSIAQKQRAQLGGLSSVKSSLDRAASSVNVALAAATAVSDLLIQLKTTAVAAADLGASTATRTALNDQFTSLVKQIGTVVDNATFNGVNAVKNGGASIQALVAVPTGTVSVASITITKTDISASAGLALTAGIVITTAATASTALGLISTAQSTVTTFLSKLGAGAKRIDIQRTFTDKLSSAIQVGIGKLVDANLALESARLKSLQVKQQLGLRALSIANAAPGSVLALFR